jgi:hypothetical protein
MHHGVALDSLTAPLLDGRDPADASFVSEEGAAYVDRSFCCFRVAYFPVGRFTVCGHWRVQLLRPALSALLICAVHCVFVLDTVRLRPYPRGALVAAHAAVGAQLLALALSYALLIARGPGYAPATWGRTRARSFSWAHAMASMVQYAHQAAAARASAERPPRSSFGASACRFVLRADHYCPWAQTWVGVRNHRFFMLTCLWCALYALASLAARYPFYAGVAAGFRLADLPGLGSVLVLLYLAALGAYHFAFAARNLARNRTAIELWNGRATAAYDKGCVANYEEVCGARRWMCCWPFPCFACFPPLEDGFYAGGDAAAAPAGGLSDGASVQSVTPAEVG